MGKRSAKYKRKHNPAVDDPDFLFNHFIEAQADKLFWEQQIIYHNDGHMTWGDIWKIESQMQDILREIYLPIRAEVERVHSGISAPDEEQTLIAQYAQEVHSRLTRWAKALVKDPQWSSKIACTGDLLLKSFLPKY